MTKSQHLKLYLIVFLALVGTFILDHGTKEFVMLSVMQKYGITDQSQLFGNFYPLYETACINADLIFNTGVAFSMFAFLEEWLKWIQLLLISGVLFYILSLKKLCYAVPTGILVGAGLSNIYDRFVHGGVVDFIHWHCGFNFAIFNVADMLIDLAVVWFLFLNFKPKYCKPKEA